MNIKNRITLGTFLYASFLIYKSHCYTGIILTDTDDGFCQLQNGTNIAVGEIANDKEKCERFSCETGMIRISGCSVVSIKPRPGFTCQLVRRGDDFPDCCLTVPSCKQIEEVPLNPDDVHNSSNTSINSSTQTSFRTQDTGINATNLPLSEQAYNTTEHDELLMEDNGVKIESSSKESELVSTLAPLPILLIESESPTALYDTENDPAMFHLNGRMEDDTKLNETSK